MRARSARGEAFQNPQPAAGEQRGRLARRSPPLAPQQVFTSRQRCSVDSTHVKRTSIGMAGSRSIYLDGCTDHSPRSSGSHPLEQQHDDRMLFPFFRLQCQSCWDNRKNATRQYPDGSADSSASISGRCRSTSTLTSKLQAAADSSRTFRRRSFLLQILFFSYSCDSRALVSGGCERDLEILHKNGALQAASSNVVSYFRFD